MNKKAAVYVFSISVFLISSCKTAQFTHFNISKEEIYSNVKIIAMAPVGVPDKLPHKKAVQSEFEKMIIRKLKGYGFKIILPEKYFLIRNALIKKRGGYYNTMTGRIDMDKLKSINSSARRQIKAIYKADAFLYPSVLVNTINFNGSHVRWHGVTEKIETSGATAMNVIFGSYYRGTCPALSLEVVLTDSMGAPIYVSAGGIELISKIGVGGSFERKPISQLLINKEANARSVNIAMDPLDIKTKK